MTGDAAWAFIERVEEAVSDPRTLGGLRDEVATSAAITDDERQGINGRIDQYLIDRDVADDPSLDVTGDTVVPLISPYVVPDDDEADDDSDLASEHP